MELTEKEKKQIQQQREQAALFEKKLRFRKAMLKLAFDWAVWKEEEGLSLTFSVFVDNFEAEDRIPDEFSNNLNLCFNSLKTILSSIDDKIDHLNFK